LPPPWSCRCRRVIHACSASSAQLCKRSMALTLTWSKGSHCVSLNNLALLFWGNFLNVRYRMRSSKPIGRWSWATRKVVPCWLTTSKHASVDQYASTEQFASKVPNCWRRSAKPRRYPALASNLGSGGAAGSMQRAT
jgi:hypothetical protein